MLYEYIIMYIYIHIFVNDIHKVDKVVNIYIYTQCILYNFLTSYIDYKF